MNPSGKLLLLIGGWPAPSAVGVGSRSKEEKLE